MCGQLLYVTCGDRSRHHQTAANGFVSLNQEAENSPSAADFLDGDRDLPAPKALDLPGKGNGLAGADTFNLVGAQVALVQGHRQVPEGLLQLADAAVAEEQPDAAVTFVLLTSGRLTMGATARRSPFALSSADRVSSSGFSRSDSVQ